MNYKISYLLVIFLVGAFVSDAYAENIGAPQGLINTSITGIKFLDAYFGTSTTKMEVGPGDKNVPLTISMANIGNSDVVGIRGQLFVPTDFTSANGKYMPIYADSDQKATAGSNFYLTFFVDIAEDANLKSYPGTLKVDYSRIRESGERQDTFGFTFNVTGESIVNLKALTPVITSITNNDVVLEISNAGSSTLSNVDVVLENTSTTISSASASTTNVEKVIFDKNHWNVGNIEPNYPKTFSFSVFVPESLKNEPLRIPVKITYFNAHGEQTSVTRIADIYINGLVKPSIYGVKVIELSGKQTVIGEILNEGNTDGLFGFVKLQPIGDSSIKESSQYIDEIEPDSPKTFSFNVFVPESLKNEPLRIPVKITYFNAHGEQTSVTRIADMYINGLVKPSIYGVKVIELSGKQTIIGEILNEGNTDGLFGFVKLQPVGDSNIKESSQYIDEIEPDSPVPFNIPIESDGMLSFGEHDIRIVVSYKDSMRAEHEISFDTTITISPFADNTDYGSMIGGIITIMVILGIVYFFYRKGKIPYVSKKIQS